MIKVIDLFSGAGGLTFGFQNKIERNRFVENSLFNIIFANELDSSAAEAFRMNFPDITMLEDDISNLSAEYLTRKYINIDNLDLIIGGPPCQSYSTVGKRQYDSRAKMYKEYRRLLSITKPKMFIFENVTGLLTMKNDEGKPVIDDVISSFQDFSDFGDDLSYTIHNKVLDSKNYGVPQSRERVFLVGIRSDLKINHEWEFPVPTYGKLKNQIPYLTLEDAIGDLPELKNGEKKEFYSQKPYAKYQRLMRGNEKQLKDHVNSINGDRMLKIMKAVIPGEGRPYINRLVMEGKLEKSLYLTSGYDNTYGKLWWDRPSTTITNNLASPSSLRCIHPLQSRALTPREGARIQSFPDSFYFTGTKDSITSQIGNAVPPLLSLAIANQVNDFFEKNFSK